MRKGVSRAACAGAVVISCVFAAGETTADEAATAADERISECVSYEQSTYDNGMRLRLESSCEQNLSCSLRWTLRCEGGSEHREGAGFELSPGAARSTRASAGSCRGEPWRIDGIRWQCRTR